MSRAGCDGVFPNPPDHTPTPDGIRELVTRVRAAGPSDRRHLDVAVAGNASPGWDEPPRADVAALTDAGMTWWMESLMHLDPIGLTRHVVDAGPPRRGDHTP